MRLVWVKTAEGRERLVDLDFKAKSDRNISRRETLTAKARRALRIQLGRDFTTESELRAHMKQNNLRFVDRGEPQEIARRGTEEYLRDTRPGKRGKNPIAKAHGYSHW